MISVTRKDVRTQFASLLSAALVGTGKPAQVVYSYRKGDLKGQSPVVVVSSLGSSRRSLTFQGLQPMYRLQVDVFVLYEDTAAGWTEADAENALDDIEKIVADVIAANQVVANYWEGITPVDWSERVDVSLGGVDYIREMILLEFD